MKYCANIISRKGRKFDNLKPGTQGGILRHCGRENLQLTVQRVRTKSAEFGLNILRHQLCYFSPNYNNSKYKYSKSGRKYEQWHQKSEQHWPLLVTSVETLPIIIFHPEDLRKLK